MVNLTIFTPTYNRKHLLPVLYDSLKRQTCKEFTWLVIDDGSTDGTEEIFREWKNKDVGFKINYIKKANGGKHTAIEEANRVCNTKYIVCIDSDDYLTDTAVETMYKEMNMVDLISDVCGVVTRRMKSNGEPFYDRWAPNNTILFFNELYTKYGYKTDTCLIFKTDIIKNYHFPIFEDEKFVTESVFYNQFLYKYKILATTNLYYVADYMEDGYTAQGMKLFFKNPKGWAYALKSNAYVNINNKSSLKTRVGASASFYAWCKLMHLNERDIGKDLKLGIFASFGKLLEFIPYKKLKRQKEEYEKTK